MRRVPSASSTTPRVTSGKSCPLATICVPTRTPESAALEAAQQLGVARRRRCRSRAGRPRAGASSSAQLGLDPLGPGAHTRDRDRAAVGAALGLWLGVAAVVAAQRRRCDAATRLTSQSGHSQARPQERQARWVDQPRRLISRIALPPSRRSSASASTVAGCSGPRTPPRMSSTSTGGSGRPSTRSGSSRRASPPSSRAGAWRCPQPARRRLRRRAWPPARARRSADPTPACRRNRAPRRSRSGPRSATGANAAERGPTAIRASPERSRRHSS